MLTAVKLKDGYNSDEDNILNDFYIPILKETVLYKRSTGYFSSSSLVIAAQGLSEFYKNEGICELICSIKLTEEDYNAIKNGSLKINDYFNQGNLLENIDYLTELQRNHLNFLSWLIEKKRLKIKIAASKDSDDILFHEKVGIMADKEGNEISFSGSVNETWKGWSSNIEEFKVFRGWVTDEKKYLDRDKNKFDKYWNNTSNKVITFDIPEVIEKKIIEIRPKNKKVEEIIKSINKELERSKFQKPKTTAELLKGEGDIKELRPYQKEAIKKWQNNSEKGIFVMATGSGKTVTAINAAKSISQDGLLLVVAVPFGHLIPQWIEDLENILNDFRIVECHGKAKGWREKTTKAVGEYSDEIINKVILIGTYSTISSDDFIAIFDNQGSHDRKMMIIGDEVHNFGAPEMSKGMIDIFSARLGLSATLARYFDEEGTDKIKNYFSGIVFEFTLEEAIKMGFLTEYLYHPILVELTEDEMEKYYELTEKMKKLSHSEDHEEILKNIAIRRSKILKSSENKISTLENLLEEMGDETDHLLVYCDTGGQLKATQEIFNHFNYITHKFTGNEAMDEREKILKNFDSGNYQALLSMKCLDEGVDVPSTRTAIIMASSGNSREYVQRRGRVLRKSPGKEYAIIYDFVVLPPKDQIDTLAKQVLQKEFTRVLDFVKTAKNSSDVIDDLIDLMCKYSVYLG